MRVTVPHTLDEPEAIRRLDRFLDALVARQWPGGVVVSDARKSWEGPRMTFAFAAGKGGFGVSIDGHVAVGADEVAVEAKVPMLVRALIGEDRLREIVAKGLSDALAAPSP